MPFRELLGHRSTLGRLSRAAGAGTLPPSLIFAGREGIGKRSAAEALAQLLNCEQPLRDVPWSGGGDAVLPALVADACGNCPTCGRIARRTHSDVLVVEPNEKGNIQIDQVRPIVEACGYRPFEARRRVVIVDGADALTPDASDALLKTLEEPPASAVIVLVTARPDALAPTVRSRCARVLFAPLPADAIVTWLMERRGWPEPQARAVAALAGGSLGAAAAEGPEALESVRASARRLLERVADRSDPRSRLVAAADLVGSGKGGPAVERQRLARLLGALTVLLRDLGVVAARADDRLVVNRDLVGDLAALARSFDGDRIGRAFATVERALGILTERNASPKIVADWVALRL